MLHNHFYLTKACRRAPIAFARPRLQTFAVVCGLGAPNPAMAQSRPSIYQTTLEELNQVTPEVSTEELKKLLSAGAKPVPVIDTRSEMEYAIAHIPGSINVWEEEAEYIIKACPDKEALIVLYCNGPY